jgi:hypothetical protein
MGARACLSHNDEPVLTDVMEQPALVNRAVSSQDGCKRREMRNDGLELEVESSDDQREPQVALRRLFPNLVDRHAPHTENSLVHPPVRPAALVGIRANRSDYLTSGKGAESRTAMLPQTRIAALGFLPPRLSPDGRV